MDAGSTPLPDTSMCPERRPVIVSGLPPNFVTSAISTFVSAAFRWNLVVLPASAVSEPS